MTNATSDQGQKTSDVIRPRLAPCDEPMVGTECATISRLNDALRRTFSGGRVVLSAGIVELPSVARAALIAAVRGFTHFDADNDPHGEHDFGMVKVAGYCCFWKIDCHDLDLRCASPDPDDPAVTVRILTVMLAEEY